MKQYSLRVRRGADLTITWQNEETGASEAELTVSQYGVVVIQKTAIFDGLTADLSLTAMETDIEEGTYDYMVTIVWDDGAIEKYPEASNCQGCKLPKLYICDSNDEVQS